MNTSQSKIAIRIHHNSIDQLTCEAIVLPIFQDGTLPAATKELDRRLGGLLRTRIERDHFKGELGKTLWVEAPGIRVSRVLLVGLGEKKKFDRGSLRDAYRMAAKEIVDRKVVSAGLPYLSGTDLEANFDAAVEGFLLNTYRFNKYRSNSDERVYLKTIHLSATDRRHVAKINKWIPCVEVGVQATFLALDFQNGPANEVTPTYLAKQAAVIAKDAGLRIQVLGEPELKKRGMNLLLAVGMGSVQRPRLVHLEYRPKKKARRSVALVGKGVTFDSGGLSLKPQDGMYGMKYDMSGAGAVLGAMWAIGKLKPSTNVHGFVPLVENVPSAHSVKPGDVFYGYNGKSVEIENTDAEGRLILADALAYAHDFKVDEILDVATLTGACVVALGTDIAGIVSNNKRMVERVQSAAQRTGEKFWELPFEKGYLRLLKSDLADLKNVGGRDGGAITAGLFLSEFVTCKSWAHLDIAGPAYVENESAMKMKGGTGFAVRTFIEFVS